MAIPADTSYNSESTMEAETIEMTIDENGMRFLMSILTNLYEDPVMAVIREYSTNAVDAHIEAGTDRPVEVTLPSSFKSEFKVRDFGVGMSYEDIRDTYSKYVASTKRQSNTQAGMFGIGSKSALAYGDRFYVESVKAGERVVCLISRTGRGSAKIDILSRSATDDANGTTIRVPVRSSYDFTQKAPAFYKYVKPGKFLVDGKDIGGTFKGVKVNEDLFIKESSYRNTKSVIVMGNVPYRIDTGINKSFVAYVEPGTFEPTPPREGLERTESFKGQVEEIFDKCSSSLKDKVSKDISSKTKSEAAVFIVKNYDSIGKWIDIGDLEYKGTKLKTKLNSDNVVRIRSSSQYYEPGDHEYNVLSEMTSLHVVGYTGGPDLSGHTVSKAYKARNVKYGYGANVYLWVDGKPDYANDEYVIDWNDARLSGATSSGSASPYKGYSAVHKAGDDWKVPTRLPYFDRWSRKNSPYSSKTYTKVVAYDDYDSTKQDLVYFSPSDIKNQQQHNFLQVLIDDDGVFLVIKNKNQFDKTKRTNPEAVHVNDYAEIKAKRLVKKYGETAFVNRSRFDKYYKQYVGTLFDEYRDFNTSNDTPSSSEFEFVRSFGADLLTKQDDYDKLVNKIQKRYPLLQSTSSKSDNQEYIYAMDYYKENSNDS